MLEKSIIIQFTLWGVLVFFCIVRYLYNSNRENNTHIRKKYKRNSIMAVILLLTITITNIMPSISVYALEPMEGNNPDCIHENLEKGYYANAPICKEIVNSKKEQIEYGICKDCDAVIEVGKSIPKYSHGINTYTNSENKELCAICNELVSSLPLAKGASLKEKTNLKDVKGSKEGFIEYPIEGRYDHAFYKDGDYDIYHSTTENKIVENGKPCPLCMAFTKVRYDLRHNANNFKEVEEVEDGIKVLKFYCKTDESEVIYDKDLEEYVCRVCIVSNNENENKVTNQQKEEYKTGYEFSENGEFILYNIYPSNIVEASKKQDNGECAEHKNQYYGVRLNLNSYYAEYYRYCIDCPDGFSNALENLDFSTQDGRNHIIEESELVPAVKIAEYLNDKDVSKEKENPKLDEEKKKEIEVEHDIPKAEVKPNNPIKVEEAENSFTKFAEALEKMWIKQDEPSNLFFKTFKIVMSVAYPVTKLAMDIVESVVESIIKAAKSS